MKKQSNPPPPEERPSGPVPPPPPVPPAASPGQDEMVRAIDIEPEYPDSENFEADLKQAILQYPGTNERLAEELAKMVIECARIAVRNTKKCIKNRILANEIIKKETSI